LTMRPHGSAAISRYLFTLQQQDLLTKARKKIFTKIGKLHIVEIFQ
jgi:hypothetical protein